MWNISKETNDSNKIQVLNCICFRYQEFFFWIWLKMSPISGAKGTPSSWIISLTYLSAVNASSVGALRHIPHPHDLIIEPPTKATLTYLLTFLSSALQSLWFSTTSTWSALNEYYRSKNRSIGKSADILWTFLKIFTQTSKSAQLSVGTDKRMCRVDLKSISTNVDLKETCLTVYLHTWHGCLGTKNICLHKYSWTVMLFKGMVDIWCDKSTYRLCGHFWKYLLWVQSLCRYVYRQMSVSCGSSITFHLVC